MALRLLVTRRGLLRGGAAMGLGSLSPWAPACEFFTASMRITHPWTRATPADSEHAVLCMKFDQVTQTDRLIGVHTPVAGGAAMGGRAPGPAVDFLIPAGSETELSEEGSFVRLLDLQFPIQIGRSYPLQLVFEVGGPFEARLSVDYSSLRDR